MAQENAIPFDLPGFTIDQIDEHENLLMIQAHSTATAAVCPDCDRSSMFLIK
jgi:hypothetical protein